MDLAAISFSVSAHAWERACTADPTIPLRDVERAVLENIRNGIFVGAGQAGRDFIVKPLGSRFAGYVFVCSLASNSKYANVRTVLREDHAIANKQALFGIATDKKIRRFNKKQKRKQKLRERDDSAEDAA